MPDERGALARGLAVINQVNDTPGMSLEQLAKTTGYPKTSLFRIMRTLVALSMVRKDSNGHYQPLARIQPLADKSFENQLNQTMKRLAEETGQAVEWYESGTAGMVITRRVLSRNTEIGVRARVGFVREWNGEMDAVLALGIAHLKPKEVVLDFNAFLSYREPFKQSRISAKFAKNRIEKATRERTICDHIPNTNNVRRAAKLVCDNKTPAGVLAIAEVVHPEQPDRIEKLREILEKEPFLVPCSAF